MKTDMNNPIHLLWTGGWDSTFRLLQILLIEKNAVKPFYLIDRKRKSLAKELMSMSEIKQTLFSDYPSTKNLISPTVYYDKFDILDHMECSDIKPEQIGKYALQSQDIWFIYLAKYLGITDFEFCMEKQSYTEGEFRPKILRDSVGTGHNRRLRNTLHDKELHGYQCMRFPLINITKAEMEIIAIENGFINILEKTWFCHFPKFGKPCGICFPCQLMMLNKLYNRMPLISRIRYHILHAMKKFG